MSKKTLGQQLVDTHEEHQKSFRAESGELVEAFAPSYMTGIWDTIRDHAYLQDKFYIQVVSKHIPMAANRGLHLTFIARLSAPLPEPTQDLWSYNPKINNLKLEWTLPHKLEMKNFLRAPEKYSPKLINDINAYLKRTGTDLKKL